MRFVLAVFLTTLALVPVRTEFPDRRQPMTGPPSDPSATHIGRSAGGAGSAISAGALDQAQPVITIAVLRRDGIIVPFAQFDGRRWRNHWPTPFTHTDVPISLANIPKRWFGKDSPGASWSAWLTDGSHRPITVRSPHLFPTHCVAGIGLTTDYRAAQPAPPPVVHHHPKDGLAVTGGLVVEPIEVLRADTPEWIAAQNLVEPHVAEIERKGESSWAWSGAGTYFNRRVRATVPLSLEVLCRAPGARAGTWDYFFEAVRRYPVSSRRSTATTFIAFSQGFVLPGRPPQSAPEAGRFAGSLEDPPDFDYLHPLGWFRLGAKHYWAVQWAGRGRERYAILEVGEKAVTEVIGVPGGGC